MRTTKIIDLWQVEADIDISLEDIRAAIINYDETKSAVLDTFNNLFCFLNTIPDSLIKEIKPESRKSISDFLTEQAKRFSPPLQSVTEKSCNCEVCKWEGKVIDCEVNEKTGELHCPTCGGDVSIGEE